MVPETRQPANDQPTSLLLASTTRPMPNCDGADRAVISHGFGMIEFPFPNQFITKPSRRSGNPRSSPARSCSRSPASSETRNQ